MGIIAYIRESENIDLRNIYDDNEEETREKLARLIMSKLVKITWTQPEYTLSQIRNAFDKRVINLQEIQYVWVSDEAYAPMRSKCVTHKHLTPLRR